MDDRDYPMLADGYLDGLDGRPTDEIRSMRASCVQAETTVSFARRLVQGRLDILWDERQRRLDGGEPADAASLIGRLPEILGEHGRAPGPGRLPQTLEPPEPAEDVTGELDAIVPPGMLSALHELDDESLASLVGRVESLEQRVSQRRRALFERIDALQAELTRRYRTGEATVESLLS